MEKKRRTTTKRGASSTKQRTAPSRNRMSQADLAALRELDQLLERRRRAEHLAAQVPAEVATEQLQYADGTVLFRFSHTQLGDLGQLRIVPVPAYMAPIGGCVVNVELFPDDPDDDPHWDEKYRLLDLMVALCTAVLPDEKTLRSQLAPLPEAREQRRLYLRFLACRHSTELRSFVNTLTKEQYPLLLAGIRQAHITASGQDQAGILQRMDEVHRLWAERQERPEQKLVSRPPEEQ